MEKRSTSLERFLVTGNHILVPVADTRDRDCPHKAAFMNIYPNIIEKDLAEGEVRTGASYCWNSCKLTNCPVYIRNNKTNSA